mmetsp:Transcript_3778/g.9634  ORF Transcript_3778/g.9634 Transcript_3778/m.9634 type:complete len:94 (+) Transcript_3778:122-403(+)
MYGLGSWRKSGVAATIGCGCGGIACDIAGMGAPAHPWAARACRLSISPNRSWAGVISDTLRGNAKDLPANVFALGPISSDVALFPASGAGGML